MTDTLTPLPREPLPPGRRLGRYQLADRLATGGMAEIFLALERGPGGLERLVVVKRILPHLAVHEQFVDMFLQEARFVARLNHPNIVQIFELGEVPPSEPGGASAFFIAMEYVAGASVRELMRAAALRKAPVPVEVAITIVENACAGAHAAHELTDSHGKVVGLVHRDISPHNLMVTKGGHVKLLDFGIAKATEVALENTRTGALKGKVHYMSPEQCRQEPLDRRSDVFALGIVLWELLTARRLFKRENDLESMQAIVTGDLWDVREFRKEVPEPIARVIEKSLALKKDDRYESADAFRRALVAAAKESGVSRGQDALGAFVLETCKKKLESDERAVEDAIERTQVGFEAGLSGEVTIAERPSAIDSTVLDASGTGTGETRAGELPSTSGPPRALIAATLALVVTVGLVAFIFRDKVFGTGEPTEELIPTSGEIIKIGQAPTVDRALLKKEFAPLDRYLEKATGRPIEIVVTKSYQDLADKLIDGTLDFGFVPPNLYIKTKERWGEIDPIVFKLQDGASGSDAVLLTNEKNRGLNSVSDLKDRVICFTDENSTSGYVYPRAHLRKNGLDPDKDFRYHRSGNHLQLLRDLVAGVCDAGGTYSGAYLRGDEKGVQVSQLRVLAITGRAPQDALCQGKKANEADTALIKAALLAFNAKRDLGVEYVGTLERMSGFVEADDADYQSLREALAPPVDDEVETPKEEPKKKTRRRRRRR